MTNTFKEGDKVYYTAPHGKKENGIIKSLTPNGEGAFVVYNCNNDWKNYQDYTGCSTNFRDLTPGWIDNSTLLVTGDKVADTSVLLVEKG